LKIYVVRGQTGHYFDRIDWLVLAFYNKDRAEELARNAEKWVLDILNTHNDPWNFDFSKNPFDDCCTCYGKYDGISYWIEEIDIEDN